MLRYWFNELYVPYVALYAYGLGLHVSKKDPDFKVVMKR